jgi:hypothetical protein
MAETLAVGVLVVLGGGVAAQWLAWRFRVPAIVLLLAVGLLAGPVFGIIHPSRAMGATLGPLVGLAVCIVVFEGGLALNIRELRAAGEGVLRLTVVALPISFVLGTVAARACTGMAWSAATLYGAITVVTGPTVILPLLRHTRLDRRAASFLKWEAIVNDPIGALLAAVVLDVATTQKAGFGSMTTTVVAGAGFAVALGVPRARDGGVRARKPRRQRGRADRLHGLRDAARQSPGAGHRRTAPVQRIARRSDRLGALHHARGQSRPPCADPTLLAPDRAHHGHAGHHPSRRHRSRDAAQRPHLAGARDHRLDRAARHRGRGRRRRRRASPSRHW